MKKRYLLLGIVILLFFFNYQRNYSQTDSSQNNNSEIQAKARLDTNAALIGDHVGLTLEFHSPKKINVVFPVISDSIGSLEIISKSKIDTLNNNGFTLKQKIVLSGFDSAKYTIPPIIFMYEKAGFSSLYPIQTDSLSIVFNGMAVDTSKEIKDIKAPLKEPFTFWDYFPYIIIPILIIGLVILGLFLWKKYKKKPEPKLKYDPKIPAHIWALQELKKLDEQKFWQKGQIKLYHSLITDILRIYMERQYNFNAMEMITDEILSIMNKISVPINLIENIKKILTLADLVKFAKFEPLPDENTLSMTLAVEFIEATKPSEIVKEAKN